jgi:uncharacterized membrane protein
MHAYPIVRAFHIAGGATALGTFWLPLVTKKGGTLHRKIGWIYVAAMAVVAVTGALLAIRYLFDDNPRNDTAGLFLFYVGLLSATSCSMGVRVLREKQRTAPHRNAWDLGLPATLLLSGLALGLYAAKLRIPLLGVFAILGISIATGQLRFWLRAPVTKRAWWLKHMSGMGVSCITTVTAFLVVNSSHFGVGRFNFVLWTAPGLVGGVGLALWERYYRSRFEQGAARAG